MWSDGQKYIDYAYLYASVTVGSIVVDIYNVSDETYRDTVQLH